MDTLNLLFYPFLGCVALILIHAYFGMHVLERGIIFVDLSLAQFVALGSALGFLLTHSDRDQYLFSFLFALLGASILSFSRQIARLVNIEAFIGVLYIFSLAMGFLVLDRTPHGLEEMKSILNGNILWITPRDVFYSCLLYGGIGFFHLIFRDTFFKLSFEGRGSLLWEFLFFLSFAIVLVSSVRMAGILQVFSFLVIPTLIGRLYSKKRSLVLFAGWVLGLGSSIVGLALSYWFDLPTAPLIVAALSCLFFVTLIVKATVKRLQSG